MVGKRVVSSRQWELIVDFMGRHPDLAKGSVLNSGPLAKRKALAAWEELTRQLNCCSQGCTKSAKEWRDYWNNSKYAVRKKACTLRQQSQKTGGGPIPKNLLVWSERDDQIYSFLSKVSVHGEPAVRIPFDDDTTPAPPPSYLPPPAPRACLAPAPAAGSWPRLRNASPEPPSFRESAAPPRAAPPLEWSTPPLARSSPTPVRPATPPTWSTSPPAWSPLPPAWSPLPPAWSPLPPASPPLPPASPPLPPAPSPPPRPRSAADLGENSMRPRRQSADLGENSMRPRRQYRRRADPEAPRWVSELEERRFQRDDRMLQAVERQTLALQEQARATTTMASVLQNIAQALAGLRQDAAAVRAGLEASRGERELVLDDTLLMDSRASSMAHIRPEQ